MEQPVTVAVVDGNPGTRQGLIRRLWQTPGMSVVGDAGNFDEALGMISSRQPDVVVMDFHRIALNGAEFLARLEAAAPEMAILVLTAYVTQQEQTELQRAGARAILLKEIDSEALVRAIQTAAGEKRGHRRAHSDPRNTGGGAP